MSWAIVSVVATVGSAVIGGVASERASKRAAKGQKRALEASQTATGVAGTELRSRFGLADVARQRGVGQALDVLAGAPEKQIAPFQQGNILAQEQISRGLPQIQNAILGRDIDLAGFVPRNVGQPSDFNFDLSGINVGVTPPTPAAFTPAVFRREDVEKFTGGFGGPRPGGPPLRLR